MSIQMKRVGLEDFLSMLGQAANAGGAQDVAASPIPTRKIPGKSPKKQPNAASVLKDLASLANTAPASADDEEQKNVWQVPADVIESDTAVTILVDLPGLKKEDISIHLKHNHLVIWGERKKIRDDDSTNVTSRGRGYGSFKVPFILNQPVGDELKASYQDGLLTVEIAKVPAKRVEIF